MCVSLLMASLLLDFKNIFPNEIRSGLPTIRKIKHQIDFVTGASISNRPIYKSNHNKIRNFKGKWKN
jgi:hypothetical protein